LLFLSRRGGDTSVHETIARVWRALRKDQQMAAENLQELFVEELRDVYDAEKQITKALPKMAKAVESDELRAAFEEHLEITRMQIDRLEEVFKSLGLAPRGKTCDGMKGLLEEGQSHMDELEGSTLEAALIGAAQRVEHYEIAAYGTLATWADLLGHQDAKDLLGQTLEEEKEADEKLTGIAGQINPEAENEEEGGENEQNSGMAMANARATRSGSASGGRGRSSGSKGKKR
jgi:ferritin-like metal-binding protein YciE